MSTLAKEWEITTPEGIFDTACQCRENGVNCDRPAEWMVWARHPRDHKELYIPTCDPHKQEGEQSWIKVLAARSTCGCGYRFEGQLSDNFKAVRLP